MRPLRLLVAAICITTCAGLALAQSQRVAGDRPDCVDVTFAALFRGLAYNHLVYVRNQCSDPVACSVTTDVNPSPQSVTVSAGASQSVTTFMGSPARVFVPTVNCSARH